VTGDWWGMEWAAAGQTVLVVARDARHADYFASRQNEPGRFRYAGRRGERLRGRSDGLVVLYGPWREGRTPDLVEEILAHLRACRAAGGATVVEVAGVGEAPRIWDGAP